MNETAPTAVPAASPPAALPRWYRLLAIVVGSLAAFVIVLVTALVWAWRGSDGARIAPWILLLELVQIALTVTVGRKAFWTIAALKYRALQTRWGQAAALLIVVGIGALVEPGLRGPGALETNPSGHRVAVIGAGSAGLHAAWTLEHAGIDFDVYEAADYIGGHAFAPVYTPEIGTPFACDIGFIFGSPTDYQEMKVLMDWYGVPRNPSELGMSGNVNGYQWASGPGVSSEAKRFQELALAQHQDPKWNLVPFGVWLNLHGFDQAFRDQYLTPMMSVLFITDLGLYEISTRFMLNMGAGRIQWIDFLRGADAWTVKGGSVAYYQKLSESFRDRIHLSTPVAEVVREKGKVRVVAYGPDGSKIEKIYDDVILAVPADVARTILKGKDWLEDFVLGEVRYKDSEVVLHTDQTLLPPKEFQRQYNYFQDSQEFPGQFELTGIMNLVHGAGEMSPLPIGSLNPLRPIDEDKVLLRRGWRHHGMDLWHLALMLEVMPSIQGRGGVWYAGDWVTVIGHGPAMRTGMAAACNAGAKTRVKKAPAGARCIDVRTEEERAGLPSVTEHLCGTEGILEYLVERNCNGFKL